MCSPKRSAVLWGRVEKFHRDGWAKPWPVGPEMLCDMVSHEAHHRGQVCMLANQLAFPMPDEVAYVQWSGEKLWKECGGLAAPAAILASHPRAQERSIKCGYFGSNRFIAAAKDNPTASVTNKET
jgi:hypothetical protein